MKCHFYKRENGKIKQNLCMAEMAILGEAGDPCTLSSDEVVDRCLTEDFRNCNRFQWVEREKDKVTIRSQF